MKFTIDGGAVLDSNGRRVMALDVDTGRVVTRGGVVGDLEDSYRARHDLPTLELRVTAPMDADAFIAAHGSILARISGWRSNL